MKLFRSITALVLTVAFLNVIVGKVVHEIFEHDHQENECELAGTIHFCDVEIAHPDFICNFNFSVSFIDTFLSDFDSILHYLDNKVKIHYLWLAKDLCSNTLSLRGPPAIS